MYANAKPGLDHYWRELSFNLANVSGSTATGWYTLTHPRSYYVYDMDADGFADLDFDRATADCTAAADATVNFSTYTGITMAFNDDLDGPATGGSMFLTLDGTTKSWGTTWLPPWAYQDINVVSHEMGHGFGLAHSSGNYGATYDNNWDVMSGSQDDCFGAAIDPTYGCMAPHTISYHKDLLGWMSGRRQDVAAGTTMTVPIDQLGATSAAMQEIKIPVASPSGNQKFYTVEARKHVGYDAKLPGEGVIIHFVDPSRVEPAHVMDSDGNGDNGDAGAIWVPGETFTDAANGVRITVNSATATGYSVTVTNGGAVNTIVDLDADGHGDAFIYKASSGVWAAQFSANVGGFTGTNGAWSPGWSVTPATFNTDALTDFFLINGSTGQWFRMTNLSGGAFSVQSTAAWSPTWQRFVVDLDGDGLSDVFLWNPTAGEWFKCLSTSGGGFTYVHGFWSAGWEVYPMRFNTDALQDFFLFNRSSGQWFWALGQAGSGFTYPASGFWSTGWQFYPGDYSGDGVTDLVLFTPANGFRFVATTGASGFTFTSGFFSTGFALYPLDLNADGRTDLFLHNASTGQWFEFTSSGTGTFTNSGNGTWTLGWSLLPSDFNGDRRGDLLLYNASTGVWFQARNLTLNAFTYNSGAWDTGLTVVANRGLP